MSISLLQKLQDNLGALDAKGLRRRRRTADGPCAPRVPVDGRPMLAFCSNDYLGLAAHPQVIAALQEGAARYGAGSGASHLISGHSRAHVLLEERLADALSPLATDPRIANVRQRGMIWACDAVIGDMAEASTFSRRFFTAALGQELLMRPIGRTLYLMPPYILDDAQIDFLGATVQRVFGQVMQK